MRPYLAVIKDSFREAMATRVLWILLVLTVLLLGVLAPFGYEVALPSRIQFPELTDPRAFLEHVKEKKDDTTTAASYVWKKLPEETRERLEKVNEDTGGVDRRRAIGELLSSVNRQAGKREFFDENVFSNVKNNEEARKLIEHGLEQLDDEQVARLNRLALDSAFGDYIEPAGKEAIQFYYLSFELGNPAPLTVNALKQIMSMSLAGFSDLIIGVLGVFIAILVTSPIIPQMFEPGAIDLLLSKPVSRSLLFLSKFFGGCIFILLIATVLITGCWAILGFQFDIWNAGLLWTIPVFVFVFAIYYTISAFAAVIWRNPVVSIVLAIVFWTVCFVVGLTKGIMEQNILDERRVAAIVPTSESLLITTENGGLSEWSGYNSTWERRYSHRGAGPFNQQARYPFIGPYLDAKEDRLIGVLDPPGRAQFFGGSAKIAVAEKENDWKPRPTVTAPAGARDLMIGEDGTIFVAGSRGLFRLKGDPGNEGDSVKVFGFQVPGLGTGPVFQPVRIEGELKWRRPVTAAMNPATGAFAIRSGEVITVIRPDRNLGYTRGAVRTVEEAVPGEIGYVGDCIIFARQDGTVEVMNDETLKVESTHVPFGKHETRSMSASLDGRYLSVVSHDGTAWMFDSQSNAPADVSLRGQGGISVSYFAPNGSFYVGDGFGRVTEYNPEKAFEVVETREPSADVVQSVYTWIVEPVYRVFPKPGEMGSIVYWLLTEQDTVVAGDPNDNRIKRQSIDVWHPLWANTAFLVVMLGITCFYISRRDF